MKFSSEFAKESRQSRPFRPEYFYSVLNLFSPNHKDAHIYQEDAQEFLCFLLDQMHEEFVTLLPKNRKQSTQMVTKEETKEDEWVEVGKKNKTSIVITVSKLFKTILTVIFK